MATDRKAEKAIVWDNTHFYIDSKALGLGDDKVSLNGKYSDSSVLISSLDKNSSVWILKASDGTCWSRAIASGSPKAKAYCLKAKLTSLTSPTLAKWINQATEALTFDQLIAKLANCKAFKKDTFTESQLASEKAMINFMEKAMADKAKAEARAKAKAEAK